MIKDTTLDEALIEILRTKKALEALRKARKEYVASGNSWYPLGIEHAAAKRASMDLTRVLAKLRASK